MNDKPSCLKEGSLGCCSYATPLRPDAEAALAVGRRNGARATPRSRS